MSDHLDYLNHQQREAVEYCDGPQLVIAGAGSGKTRVLTYKIVHLINLGIMPYRIMALTFTNKAAREMRDRIEGLVGHDIASQLWMGTFHSIFARLLRINAEKIGYQHDFTIYDSSDSKSLIKLIIKDMALDDKVYKPSVIQNAISNAKNNLFSPEDYAKNADLRKADENANRPLIYQIYQSYWHRCRVSGAMDFDDLLFYTNILLRDNPDVLEKYQNMFQYILVDEYQDTNFAQHLILVQLSRLRNKLCVVGDDAQSIYSFRGANIDNILNLQKVFPTLKTYKLEQNYRSTKNIINAANSLISKNKGQIVKHLFSENPQGSKIEVIKCYSDFEEAYVVANKLVSLKARQGCCYNDIAILYRTNAQSRVLEEAFSNGGRKDKHGNIRSAIPYRIYGGLSFYQRKEIKDAVCYFRLSLNHDDDEALRRIVNYPARGIGETTMGKVQHCALVNRVSMWQVMCNPEKFQLNVNKGTIKKFNTFIELINGFAELNHKQNDAHTVAKTIISDSKLLSVLQSDNSPENISRQENLIELINGVKEFVDGRKEEGEENILLTDYLATISLMTDQDEEGKDSGDCVTLMTVHAAKGLEFKNVFVVGVEEDLFPSKLSLDSIREIEEERRLLYVAITRAKHNCTLSYAISRYINGETKSCNPSRFLRDIDTQYLDLGGVDIEKNTSAAKTTAPTHISIEQSRKQWNPHSVPVKGAPEPIPTTSGQFTTHSVDELVAGMRLQHNRFGKGVINQIDDMGSDTKLIVEFDTVGTKTLLLKYAKFEILNN